MKNIWLIFFLGTAFLIMPQRLKAQEVEVVKQIVQEQIEQVNSLIERYHQRLGLFHDPFSLVLNEENGKKIYERLSKTFNIKTSKWELSPLAKLDQAIEKSRIQGMSYNIEAVESLIYDCEKSFSKAITPKEDLQSNLLALKNARRYHHVFFTKNCEETGVEFQKNSVPEQENDDVKRKENKENEQSQENLNEAPVETNDSQQEDSGQSQDSKDKKKSSPQHIEAAKSAKPFTKNLPPNADPKDIAVLAEVNFPTAYFGQKYYQEITRKSNFPFQSIELPISLSQPRKFQRTEKELIINPMNKNKLTLSLPPQFKPLQPSDSRASITQLATGDYVLTTSSSLQEVHIPLVEDDGIRMLPQVREIYTGPVGFNAEEWPEKIKVAILHKYSVEDAKQNPLGVALVISHHIALEYLYAVSTKPETDPVAALEAGSFQCDIASYAMISLLRDVYKIPSRVAVGFRAQRLRNELTEKSYLLSSGVGHVWVEVFHEGKWHPFDPTPIKKEREDKENDDENKENPYTDRPLDNQAKNDDEKRDGEQGSEDIDHKELLEEVTQKTLEDLKNLLQNKTLNLNDTLVNREELENLLKLGSLELNKKERNNPLWERIIQNLMKISLNPTFGGMKTLNYLNQLAPIVKSSSLTQLQKIYQAALEVHRENHPDFYNWFQHWVSLLATRSLSESYPELVKINRAAQLYAAILALSEDDSSQIHYNLIRNLNRIKEDIESFYHSDGRRIGLVQKFVKELPPIARLILKEKFGLIQVGDNPPTINIANQLVRGQLQDLRLIAILNPLSEFILDPTFVPEGIDIKTFLKDPAGKKNYLFPFQGNFALLHTVILGQAGKTLEENMEAGTAYVPGHRKKAKVPRGSKKVEPQRITIVLYDVSGSMQGNPLEFQSGLIATFVAKALGDKSPSGRHRHQVVLIPFAGSVGRPQSITNTQEALALLSEYQKTLSNVYVWPGTNIQEALIQAMSVIANAQKRSGEPLASANIILMSDGQASINKSKLLSMRQSIDRKTPLQIMFVAINTTNNELIEIAMDSQAIGAKKAYYREFSNNHLNNILHESKSLPDVNLFYSNLTSNALSAKTNLVIDESLNLARRFVQEVEMNSVHQDSEEHFANFNKIKWNSILKIDRSLEEWIFEIRRNLMLFPVFKNQMVGDVIVDDLMRNFKKITLIELKELTGSEQEQLRHMISEIIKLKKGF